MFELKISYSFAFYIIFIDLRLQDWKKKKIN